jgi:hypothetical protein
MRQNGHGALTLEDACTWLEETGLCLFLPKRQFSNTLAPSFVEAIAGQHNSTPEQKQIAIAEELLVRLEEKGVAVRLNLLGTPGEQPDYVVAAWVLPYVYALRGDRDWRRTPQLTGSRAVSPLAIQLYKRLESNGEATVAELKQALGQGVTEVGVLRAITELWQQLRIIPVIAAPGKAAKWQLLRHRFQKAIAEGASTSQVTAISVLASIFLQAVIAASMEEVEIFLSPLTARSKIREVIRGLVATRQVHTLSLGHAPHFYVAGTLPEFAPAATSYTSSIGSSYIPYPHDEEPVAEPAPIPLAAQQLAAQQLAPQRDELPPPPTPEVHEHRALSNGALSNGALSNSAHTNGAHRPAPKPAAPRPHFSRPARDRKPAASESNSRRPAKNRSTSRSSSSRPAAARWASNGSKTTHSNGPSRNGSSSRNSNGNHATAKNGSNGHSRPAGPARPANGSRPASTRSAKPASRSASLSRPAAAARKTSGRKPALAASNGSKRFGFSSKQGSKKRG